MSKGFLCSAVSALMFFSRVTVDTALRITPSLIELIEKRQYISEEMLPP